METALEGQADFIFLILLKEKTNKYRFENYYVCGVEHYPPAENQNTSVALARE
jgi:hypothetical protein